jgi:hypothetical protein
MSAHRNVQDSELGRQIHIDVTFASELYRNLPLFINSCQPAHNLCED